MTGPSRKLTTDVSS